jgi:hypothetical protein
MTAINRGSHSPSRSMRTNSISSTPSRLAIAIRTQVILYLTLGKRLQKYRSRKYVYKQLNAWGRRNGPER